MKNVTFVNLLIALLVPILVSGQLIDIGTKWTYEGNSGFFPPLERIIETINVVSDTIIDGEEFLVLEGGCNCSDPVQYLRIEGRKYSIYYDGAKHLLYDFDLVEGDVLAIRAPLGNADQDSVKVRIKGVSTIVHEGQSLIVQEVESNFSNDSEFWSDWGPTFVEGIGSIGFCFFPQFGLCETGTGPLRCIDFADGTNIRITDEPFCDELTSLDPWRVGSQWTYRQWGLPSNSMVVNFSIIEAGRTYKQLVRLTENGDVMAGSEIDIWTEEEKVYYLDSLDQKRLMYDFSGDLSVGDTIEYWLPPNANMYDISSNGGMEEISNPYEFIIKEISLVTDENGENLRKYVVDPWALLDTIDLDPSCNLVNEYVENVGGLPGFIRMGCEQLLGGTGPEFRCFNDNSFEYKEVADGQCLIVGTDDYIVEEVSLYPNPVTDILYIETAASLTRIEIFDSMGKLVQKNAASQKLNIANLQEGIYIVLLTDERGLTSSKKIAKF